MRLVDNWRRVLSRAWSIRLIVLAALLSGIEVALPLTIDVLPIPPGIFAGLSLVVTSLAFIARVVAQSNIEDKS